MAAPTTGRRSGKNQVAHAAQVEVLRSFCDKYGLSAKMMREISQLRQQLLHDALNLESGQQAERDVSHEALVSAGARGVVVVGVAARGPTPAS